MSYFELRYQGLIYPFANLFLLWDIHCTVKLEHWPVEGVLFPHRQVERQLATGEVLATVTVRRIRLNPPLGPERFAPR